MGKLSGLKSLLSGGGLGALGGLFGGAKNGATSGASGIGGLASGLFGGAKNGVQSGASGIGSIGNGIVGGASNGGSSLLGKGKNMFGGFFGKLLIQESARKVTLESTNRILPESGNVEFKGLLGSLIHAMEVEDADMNDPNTETNQTAPVAENSENTETTETPANGGIAAQVGSMLSSLTNNNSDANKEGTTTDNTNSGSQEGEKKDDTTQAVVSMITNILSGDKKGENGEESESGGFMDKIKGVVSALSGGDKDGEKKSSIGSWIGSFFGSSKSLYATYLENSALHLQAIPIKHDMAKGEDIQEMLGLDFNQLKAKVLRGNIELALFSHVAANQPVAKHFVHDLYHYMAGNEGKHTLVSELGDYLTLLKNVAGVTQDTSINEFLGAFDKIAMQIHNQ
jgi:hypothetical protein